MALMPGKLLQELKQTKESWSIHTEAYLNLQRTAELQLDELAALLKNYGLTAPQYNVLRILRGAGEAGIPSSLIGERMLNRDSDITRLVDRLVAAGHCNRTKGKLDKRVTNVTITELAMQLLERLDKPVDELHRRQFGQLSEEEAGTFIGFLESVR